MELLKKLTLSASPSGRENAVREIISEQLNGFCDESYTDALGNLICHKKGEGKKLMICAHMDEIGFMITYIDDAGFLRFAPIGGIAKHNTINTPVEFINGVKGKISYQNKENPSSINFDKMYIDIGASEKSEAESKVQIGDMAVYSGCFEIMGDKVMSKSLDDRSGCWAVIRALQNLKESNNDIYAVFTAQEEVGLRGAKTAANLINPDIAIAVDVSNVGDTPESNELNLKLGYGPGIKLKDASFIIHETVKALLLECAKKGDVPYQLEAANTGGTDVGAIHLSGGGIASGTISIPTRYIHSASEVIDRRDLENTVLLLQKVLETDIESFII